MKKFIRWAFFFLFIIVLIPSCELLDCKDCSYVTYEDGDVVSETTSISYCGEELADIEAEESFTVGTRTTRVECY